MTTNRAESQSKGMSGAWVVLGLFVGVVAIFLAVSYGFRPSGQGPASEADDDGRRQREAAFIDAMNSGKNFLDQGRQGAAKAIDSFTTARSLNAASEDVFLNLANAYLLNNEPEKASEAAQGAIELNRNLPAAYYLLGCSDLRRGRFEEALKSLQIAKDLDHTINAVSFQLGRAHQGLGQWEPAAVQFREVTQFDAEHGAAFYNLSQVLVRLGDEAGAEQALTQHQAIAERLGATITDPSLFEQCVYTEARVPFRLEQPESEGIAVQFVEATEEILGRVAEAFSGPVGIIDVGHDGQLDLFARNREEGFQLLLQREGRFEPEGFPYPPLEGATYWKCLVGDLQHKTSLMGGRQEDVVLLTDQGTQVFRVSPSGMLSDSSLFAQIADQRLLMGHLIDLDLTGKLDLVGLNPTNRSLVFLRNQGNFSFIDHTASTNLPSHIEAIQQFVFEDWDGDDLLDLFLVRDGEPPQLWLRDRNKGFGVSELSGELPPSLAIALGDLNNDLRADLVSLSANRLTIQRQGEDELESIVLTGARLASVRMLDYDNDGWLDLVGLGEGTVRVWRNRGLQGFSEVTKTLGLAALSIGTVQTLAVADLDGDCDPDWLLTMQDGQIKVLRNDGGNQNKQLKLRLEGNRSNPSALGIKLEITSGGLRLIRTVRELPVEIGLGQRERVDAINPHWSDLVTTTDFELTDCAALALPELELPTGSCPYMYVWDGTKYRFVTDLLGAAPLGLPVAEGRLIPADTDEWVWVGSDVNVRPKDGEYVVQITEELREVLYLDQARFVAVDHPSDVEVYPTNKLVPAPPFPEASLIALHRPRQLRAAVRSDGKDVREALLRRDKRMVSPVALRSPQLRGLAEPYHIDLDFGEVDTRKPLVLALHGWLRFGGGMANIGASHDPELPFPFPVLSVELEGGRWQALDVVVGAPAGKTKAMVVDLEGQLPVGTRRLRLAMAFEIHWDRIALMEKYQTHRISPHPAALVATDLHWRGFSDYVDLPWDQPLSPDYDRAQARAPWLITPSGWCTGYGAVDELLQAKDDRLVLMNGGDELTLRFSASSLPELPAGTHRDYFLFTSGWDKDADPHVVQGWTVGPLPWHGMDSQRYGQEARPPLASDGWQAKYNTRWIGQFTLHRRSEAGLE